MSERTDITAPPLRVRPYTVTRGRTSPDVDLDIETMITSTGRSEPTTSGPAAATVPEATAILELCDQPQSIAEISAHLGLPLQVVRILVADLLGAGLAASHALGGQPGGRPDLALLERVLDGLQSL